MVVRIKVSGFENEEVEKLTDNTPEQAQGRESGNNMKRVPVIVMLAMTAALLSSNSTARAVTLDPEQLTEVMANIPVEAADEMTASFPEVQRTQQSYPLGVAFFRDVKIQQIKPAVGNSVKAKIVLVTYGGERYSNNVRNVYYIKDSYSNSNPDQFPPEVKGLVYHDLGSDKSYLGIILSEKLYSSKTAITPRGRMEREVKLDDESAQFLLDLKTNDTKWNDKTNITFSETTNPKVMPPQVY